MPVPVVDVWVVGVAVHHRQVLMLVGVWLLAIPVERVGVLVVHVVAVTVRMNQLLMTMLVSVRLGEVQGDADRHQCGGKPEHGSGRLVQ